MTIIEPCDSYNIPSLYNDQQNVKEKILKARLVCFY